MNPLDTTFWFHWVTIVAAEVAIVFGVISAAMLLIKSISWRKALWQAGIISALLLLITNTTGVENGMATWLSSRNAEATERKIVTRIVENDPGLAATPALAVPPVSEPIEDVAPETIWWPAWLWLSGVVMVSMRVVFARTLLMVLCRRRSGVTSEALIERVASIATQFGIRQNVRLLRSDAIRSPIAFGIFRPSIVLPSSFETNFNPAQQDAMLSHELAHLAARDPLWYLIADIASALLWWHPAVWWARRRLHVTSEIAADEATAVFENGPGSLAECLVHFGRELSAAPSFGWLGIEGNFRSVLGQRVERLLNLGHQPGQPRPRIILVTKVTLTLSLVGLIALTSGLAQTKRGLNTSAGAQLFSALNNPVSTVPADRGLEKLTYPKQVAAQLQPLTENPGLPAPPVVGTDQGLFPLAQKSPVSAQTNTAVATQPADKAPGSVSKPIVEQTQRNVVNTSPQRKQILSKLETITFDEIAFDGLPLIECIKLLSGQAAERDPEKTGINFMIQPEPGSKIDFNSVLVRIYPPLKRLRLIDVLDVIVQTADTPIRYEIADYAVVFSERKVEAEELFTRQFKVDPVRFIEALTVVKPELKGRKDSDLKRVLNALQSYLKDLGANLTPPKSLFLNDRSGVLIVRGSLKDLEIVESAIQSLDEAPPQVSIEAKFVEMDDATWEKVASQLFSADSIVKNATSTVAVNETNVPNSVATNITSILTQPQFRKVIADLEKRAGVDVLSAPKVTTMSGRQAQVSVLDIRTIVTGLETVTNNKGVSTNTLQTAQLPTGPVLDVIPFVSADGFSIRMTVIATVNEFLGYDEPDKALKSVAKDVQLPLPRLRSRQATTAVAVFDGQTVVLGGLTAETAVKLKDKVPALGSLPFIGRLFRNESTSIQKRNLMIFVTPRIIDSSGKALHAEQELSKGTKVAPFQSKPK